MAAIPIVAVADGVILTVKLTPKSRRGAIEDIGEEAGPRGPEAVLRARVAAPPSDGQANAALIELLAGSWNLPRRDLTLVGGTASRVKRIHIRGDAAALRARLAALMGQR
jgi:uncharacterized protein (TIGR00251 family)